MNFDGKIENHLIYPEQYPVYAAIVNDVSSLEVTNNNIKGFTNGIVCFGGEETGIIKFTHNNISSNNGIGIQIHGSYEMEISHNKIHSKGDIFNEYFPDWHGIFVTGGTGVISKNKISFTHISEYPFWSTGITLFECDPPDWSEDAKMHNMVIEKNIISNTGTGIHVNDDRPDAEWSIDDLSLLFNRFIKVDEPYVIFNGETPVLIKENNGKKNN